MAMTWPTSIPIALSAKKKTGSSSVTCTVTPQGRLVGCRVASESPEGYGFGEAEVHAASRWKMKPAERDGKAVEGIVTVPIKWQLASG